MNKITDITSNDIHEFRAFGSGEPIETHQYAYTDTHIFRTIAGVKHVASITDEQRKLLDLMAYDDYIGPAHIFNEAEYN